MPWVSGAGFEMGLRLGQAKAEQDKERRYQEDRKTALAQAQARERAALEGAKLRIDQMEEDAGAGAPAVGPPTEAAAGQRGYFDRLRSVVQDMDPGHRERFVGEEQERQQNLALGRARKKVGTGIAERRARGAYLFLDEAEVNPEIDARLDDITEALDSDQINPIAAAELEAKLLETVRKENERRQLQKRGTAMIERELESARASNNMAAAKQLETLASAWGTQELDFDDAVDRLFEIQHGRPTARGAGPSPFELRKAALELWSQYEQGPPTAEGLQQYMDMLDPRAQAPLQPPTERQQRAVREDAFTPERGQAAREQRALQPKDSPAPAAQQRGATPSGGAKSRARQPEGRAVPSKEPPAGALSKMQASGEQRAARARGEDAGGLPPRPWAKLKPAEQKQAAKDLEAVARKGGDLRAALKSLGITDPDNLPPALQRRLLELVKGAGKPTTVGRPQHAPPRK